MRRDVSEAIDSMKAFKKKVTSSKEEAIRVLKLAGIMDEHGKIVEEYKILFETS